MSKRAKKHYKQFPLDSIEEGLQALGSLISNVMINLKKYMEYSSEFEYLLNKYGDLQKNGTKEIYIPAKEYDNINDKFQLISSTFLLVNPQNIGNMYGISLPLVGFL